MLDHLNTEFGGGDRGKGSQKGTDRGTRSRDDVDRWQVCAARRDRGGLVRGLRSKIAGISFHAR